MCGAAGRDGEPSAREGRASSESEKPQERPYLGGEGPLQRGKGARPTVSGRRSEGARPTGLARVIPRVRRTTSCPTRTPQSSTSSQHREQPQAQQCYSIVSGHACFERSRSKHAGRQRVPRTARGHPTPMASLKSQKHHRRAKTVVIMHLLCKSREAPSRVHGACTDMHKSSSASCLRALRLVSGTNCNEWTQSPRRRARFPIVLQTVVVSCTLAQTQALW